MYCRLSVLLLVSLLFSAVAFCAIYAPAVTGRVLHVSQRPLLGIAADQQFRTISAAAKIVEPGDTVLIHTGTYREQVTVETSGTAKAPIIFTAAPAAHVVITGADRMSNWTRVDGPGQMYSTPWDHVFLSWSADRAHPEDDANKLVGRCEQVFVMGYALRQVLQRSEMARGTFYVDEANKLLYAWAMTNARLADVPVEASTRSKIWESKGAYLVVRGLRFRYAANSAQDPAVSCGTYDTMEDCVIERMNGDGLGFGGDKPVIRGCLIQDNGEKGFGASGNNVLVSGCIIRNNNIKDFERGWDAGGDKICFSHDILIEKCQFIENRGVGLWFDISNVNPTVRNCLFANNEDAGIFYEISYGLHATDNVFVGNGFSETPGAWGGQAGICLSSSPNCVIERNLFVGNREGFNFREQTRSTQRPSDGKTVWIWNHDQIIRNNVLAYNRDAQTWGWFDSQDQQWPRSMQKNADAVGNSGKAVENIAAKYVPDDTKNYPQGMSLETLNIKFQHNFYAVTDGEELFNWGTAWHMNQRYPTLDAVRKELNLEQGSVIGDFNFADAATMDFRVPANSPVLKMGCYPKGEVPGVTLGIIRR
jgi:hypothetical protein